MIRMEVKQGFNGEWIVVEYTTCGKYIQTYHCHSQKEALELWAFWVMP